MSVDSTDSTPNHRQLSADAFQRRIADLRERYADCDLCAYECHVDRTAGRKGTCQVDDTAYVSTYFPHFGKEDCLRGHNGSGTIFLANCNMKCVFCQNFETSHEAKGDPATAEDIAGTVVADTSELVSLAVPRADTVTTPTPPRSRFTISSPRVKSSCHQK